MSNHFLSKYLDPTFVTSMTKEDHEDLKNMLEDLTSKEAVKNEELRGLIDKLNMLADFEHFQDRIYALERRVARLYRDFYDVQD